METKPFWSAAPIPSYAALDRDIVVDVLVIGAGITGVTTAFLLQSEGLDVALVEREEIACGDTGHTTAHLTYMTDTRLSDLVLSTSLQAAGIAWHAGKTAMDFISDTVESQQIDAALAKVPGYLAVHAEDAVEEELTRMKRERDWCGQLGLPVHLDEHDPIRRLPALCFPDQMKFHPGKYLAGLVKRASIIGARIHENTRVSEFGGDHVVANGHRIVYDRVVIATHVPLQGDSGGLGAALFQTKLALYSTYAIAARLSKRAAEEMIWSDTADPFHYVRIDRHEEGDIVILGGCDHKTGQKEAGIDPYRVLEDRLADWFPGAVRTHRWSGQVVETHDGLPFIGLADERQFIATGFSGNGMTFGTAAALMARDAILDRENPWAECLAPSRKMVKSLGSYLGENADFPVRLITDRFRVSDESADSVAPGDGRVVRGAEGPVAVFRDDKGALHLHTAVCPHLGCIVAWNRVERTWDCPCHGSRFSATGELIGGPAETGLKPALPDPE